MIYSVRSKVPARYLKCNYMIMSGRKTKCIAAHRQEKSDEYKELDSS